MLAAGMALACAAGAAPAMSMPARVSTPALSLTITAKPASVSKSSTAVFTWTKTGATRTLCKRDARPWLPCSLNKITYKLLGEGTHGFWVRVNNARGQALARSYHWRIDRTPPTAPTTVSGGSSAWTAGSRSLSAAGATDGSWSVRYQYRTSADGGTTWSLPVTANPAVFTATTDRIVQFRALDLAGNVSAWAPAVAGSDSTIRVDRTAPTAPAVSGGSSSWQNLSQVDLTAGGSADGAGSGFDHYEVQTSTDGGATWSPAAPGSLASRSAEGETLARFSALDAVGNRSPWVTAVARIDRTAPADPTTGGGSPGWQALASLTVSAGASSDGSGAGVAGYEYSTSTDGGATWSAPVSGASKTVTAEGQTLVRFRALDNAGLASGWVQETARLDRSAPTAPAVSGPGAAWQHVPLVAALASGSVDVGGAGFDRYQYSTSTDGVSWGVPVDGGALTFTGDGGAFIRFRAVDAAGNASAWVSGPVRVDDTAPTDPTVSGAVASWTNAASGTVSAGGSTDAGGSGLAHYERETSIDGGTTWSVPVTGASLSVTAEGETLVRYRAVDVSGMVSNWVQAPVRLDRSGPSTPTVSGTATSWQHVASVTASAAGSSDGAGSGFGHYDYATSTDGVSWTAAATGAALTLTSEGGSYVRFRAVDAIGNASAWVSGPVRIDRTAPTGPTVTGGVAAWTNAASATVAASGSTDSPGSGLSGYEPQTSTDGGLTWSAAATGASLAVTAEGETLVRYRAVDVSGLTSSWVQVPVRLDRTAPGVPTVTGTAAAWQHVASVVVTAAAATDSGGSSVAGYEYATSTDNVTWTAAQAGAALTLTAEGQKYVRFRSVDGAGNVSAWVSGPVRIDRTAPTDPTVTGGVAAWTNAASATVAASGSTDSPGSGISGYERQTSTDGGLTWSATAAGSSLAVTAQGETLVRYHAVDVSGLSSNWVQVPVRLDRTAPTTPTVSGGSTSWQSVASITVTGSGSTDSGGSLLAGYQHRTSTDGGTTWSAATAGAAVTVTAQGRTIVQVRSIDGTGNTSAWVADEARIDTTAPTAPTVTGGSLSWQSVASVTVTAAAATDSGGSGLAGYETRVSTDGGATWSAGGAGATRTISAEGSAIVQGRSLDGAGNASAWAPASATAGSTVKIDRNLPTAPTVSGGSSSWQSAASVNVTASGSTDSGSGLTGYEYRLSTDSGTTWTAAVAGASAPVSGEGTTIVQFRAVDASAQKSAWTPAAPAASSTVKLDRTAPVAPAVSGGSAAWQNVASMTISAAGSSDPVSGLAGYQYRTSTDNGTTWSAPSSGATLTVSAEGQTLVQFRASDNTGNATAWVAASALIDRAVPTLPAVSGGSASWQTVASVNVTASGSTDSGSGLAAYQYQTSTDGGTTWSTAATGSAVSVSAEGTTLVQFRAVDNAGFTSAWTASATVKLDRLAPTAPVLTGGGPAWSTAASITVTASGSTDGGSGVTGYRYQTSTNGGVTWSASTTGPSLTVSTPGETLVRFQTWDGLNQASPWTQTQMRMDRTAPTAPAVTGGSLSWLNLTSTILTAAGSTDTGGSAFARYEYRTALNGGAWSTTVTSGSTAAISTEGTTTVQFRAVDGAGNVSAWAPAANGAVNTVKLDRSAPTLPTVNGGSLSCAKKRTISASGSTDAGSGLLRYESRRSSNNGVTWSATTTGGSVTLSTTGTWIVQFRSVDNLGLTSAWAPATAGAANTACIK